MVALQDPRAPVVLELEPLSLTVLLVLSPEGYRLSDGRRFTTPYPDAAAAMADRRAFRQLTFGEELGEDVR